MLIFIIGYMGSGKSMTGRKLAHVLHYRFLDMDEMIEVSSGYSVKDFFEKYGEKSFRNKERELLISHLHDKDLVVATGGGTPCYEDNMNLMNAWGITVFLDIPFDMIMARLSGKFLDRPLLSNIPQEQLPGFIRQHLEARRSFYSQARIRVEDSEPDIMELAAKLIQSAS